MLRELANQFDLCRTVCAQRPINKARRPPFTPCRALFPMPDAVLRESVSYWASPVEWLLHAVCPIDLILDPGQRHFVRHLTKSTHSLPES